MVPTISLWVALPVMAAEQSVQWTLPETAGSHAIYYRGAPAQGPYRYAVVFRDCVAVHESVRYRGASSSPSTWP